MDNSNFNGYFFLALTGLVMGCVYHSVRYCFKSKCSDCNICFGLIKIHRETAQELQEMDEQMPKPPTSRNSAISFNSNFSNV